MSTRFRRSLVLALAAALLPWPADRAAARPPDEPVGPRPAAGPAATVSAGISYQGRLTDPASGNPQSGSFTMRFQLYDDDTAGSQLWDSGDQTVVVANGLFNVRLNVDPAVVNGQGLWLRTQVGGQWLSPRRELLPVPYALALRPGAEVLGNLADEMLTVRNEGTSPGSTGIFGTATGTSGQTFGVWGTSRSSAGTAVYGNAEASSGTTTGLYGVARSPDGRALYASNAATTGDAYGVVGRSMSTTGYGVFGEAAAATGLNYGVYGRTASNAGSGLFGNATAGTGQTYGLKALNASTGGTGVLGQAMAASGGTVGVMGVSNSSAGRGTVGIATAGTGETSGVYGEASSSAGYGLRGRALASSGPAIGVFGDSASSGGYGVHGVALGTTGATRGVSGIAQSPDGYGGYFRNQSGGTALRLGNPSGPLIEAWDEDPSDLRFRVANNGNVYADGTFNPGGADLAELLPAAPGLAPGEVLVIGPDGMLARSTMAYATAVAGVYSTAPGFVGGASPEGDDPGKVPLAIIGVVPVKASAENGPIRPGDLLTSAATPGHAMRATEVRPGTLLGKALSGLAGGRGLVTALLTLH